MLKSTSGRCVYGDNSLEGPAPENYTDTPLDAVTVGIKLLQAPYRRERETASSGEALYTTAVNTDHQESLVVQISQLHQRQGAVVLVVGQML
jgi:hypothetical protein